MAGMEQIIRGASMFLSKELAPMMDKGKAILVEAFGPTIIEAKLRQYMQSGLLEGTGIVDGANVDIDRIYKLVKQSSGGRWPLELFGFKFDETDLDKLYRYIKEA